MYYFLIFLQPKKSFAVWERTFIVFYKIGIKKLVIIFYKEMAKNVDKIKQCKETKETLVS